MGSLFLQDLGTSRLCGELITQIVRKPTAAAKTARRMTRMFTVRARGPRGKRELCGHPVEGIVRNGWQPAAGQGVWGRGWYDGASAMCPFGAFLSNTCPAAPEISRAKGASREPTRTIIFGRTPAARSSVGRQR